MPNSAAFYIGLAVLIILSVIVLIQSRKPRAAEASCLSVIVKIVASVCVIAFTFGAVFSGYSEGDPAFACVTLLIGVVCLYWTVFVYRVSGSALSPDDMTGSQYEQYVAEKLRDMGYRKIKFTPASGDHGADIIAVAPDGVQCAVQCKRYAKKVGNKAIQEALAGAAYYGCERAIVATNNQFTPQAIHDAETVGVVLFAEF